MMTSPASASEPQMMSDAWVHRLCERCWFDGTEKLQPPPGVFGEDDDEYAGAYRMPTQVSDPNPDPCCGCGGLTITGIYYRAEPGKLLCRGSHSDDSWSRLRVDVDIYESLDPEPADAPQDAPTDPVE